MKIRNGFVSNSSSSSFIVTFDRVPYSAADLRLMLFGGRVEYPSPYSAEYWTTEQVSEIVWKDMERQGPNNWELINAVASRGFPGSESLPSWDSTLEEYKEYSARQNKARQKWIGKLKKEESTAGKVMYALQYSDDTALGSAMEHGILFDRVECIRISNH